MKRISGILIFIGFSILIKYGTSVKVCKTAFDYYKIKSSNCRDNEDSERNITEIIQNWGVTAEEYHLRTDDGYNILVVRAYKSITKSTPIVISHGQHHNGLAFVASFNKSMAYVLVDWGYDVYIINYRGTRYSSHVNLTFSDRAFWDFSFHEMAVYDLRTSLKFINEKTNKSVNLIGFSMGTTTDFVYASTYPTEASSFLKGILSLGPLATLEPRITSPAVFGAKAWKLLRPVFEVLGNGKFLPRIESLGRLCASSPAWIYICDSFIAPLIGLDLQQIDFEYRPVTYILFYDTIGIGIINHYAEIYNSKEFRPMDFGKKKNQILYGSAIPPMYNLSKITVPNTMIVGQNDPLATPENAREIYNKLTGAQCGFMYVKRSKWNHYDFAFAKDVNPLLYDDVLKTALEQLESQTC